MTINASSQNGSSNTKARARNKAGFSHVHVPQISGNFGRRSFLPRSALRTYVAMNAASHNRLKVCCSRRDGHETTPSKKLGFLLFTFTSCCEGPHLTEEMKRSFFYALRPTYFGARLDTHNPNPVLATAMSKKQAQRTVLPAFYVSLVL